ncbi:hypothetical protein [Herbaspirillum sp. ST 5-3]|uniref:hypothetical protein n=1 Tax=Oxalobacteraceae TaxID=75682 RepID=UPI0010A3748C|nr:hypothetical protein [Herbaspirillum sp. ST 5-3]
MGVYKSAEASDAPALAELPDPSATPTDRSSPAIMHQSSLALLPTELAEKLFDNLMPSETIEDGTSSPARIHQAIIESARMSPHRFNFATAFQTVSQTFLRRRRSTRLPVVTEEAIARHARLDDQLFQQRIAKLFARALSIEVAFYSLTAEKSRIVLTELIEAASRPATPLQHVHLIAKGATIPISTLMATIQAMTQQGRKDLKIGLDARGRGIGEAGAILLSGALQDSRCKLVHLDVSRNLIDDAGATALAAALQHPYCRLTHLGLSGNAIGGAGAIALTNALTHPACKLTSLNMFVNHIGDTGAIALAAALKGPNCKLTHLDVGVNDISDAGAIALAAALRHPACHLTHLDLKANNIGEIGTKFLASALKHSHCKLHI